MTVTNIDEILLPNEHSAAECWNPHYHEEPFRADLAEIFDDWYREHYGGRDNEGLSCRAGPLCIFGGVSFNRAYIEGAGASGTYAVCPNCKKIIMCGYADDTGLGPRECDKCLTKLTLNCYFQPIKIKKYLLKSGKINHKRDPFVAFAEIAALAPEGIPFSLFEDIAYILVAEKLIKKRSYVYGYLPITLDTSNELLWLSHKWVHHDNSTAHRPVKITDEGRAMLRARNIAPLPAAKERVRELLAMSDKKRMALCLRSRATIIER